MSVVVESRQETAKRVRQAWVMNDLGKEGDLEKLDTRIEAALKERDERAAGICEAGAMLASPNGVIPADDPEHERLQGISDILNKAAAAIRNEESHA